MKICVISDVHGQFNRIDSNLIKGHVLIVCGDSLKFSYDEKALREFNTWLGKTKPRHKIVIWGNHNKFAYRHPKLAEQIMTNAVVLNDSGIEIDGVKFWGSPITRTFMNWAFMRDDNTEDIENHYNMIPEDTDVLITHGPNYGILDENNVGEKCGSVSLLNKVFKIKPKLHLFGHIHHSNGVYTNNDTTFVNASLLNDNYFMEFNPKLIQYKKDQSIIFLEE
jgi:Icc-related predicted phosphoesterase